MFITKEKHDALVNEAAAAKQELVTMKADNDSADAEVTRLESELKKVTDDAGALKVENEKLKAENESLKAENASLKAQISELKKLPGAETATTTKDKEQGASDDKSVKLASSDDKSFMDNLKAVKEQYL
jgi:regulator of replication initiation timing